MKTCQSTSLILKCLILTVLFPVSSYANDEQWIGSWYAAPVEFAPQFSNSTLRSVVHLTAGGSRLRLRLSNVYGQTPLKIGAAYVAVKDTVRQVTFGGRKEAILQAGTTAASDPVNLTTSEGTELAVSVFYPETIPQRISMHLGAINTLVSGNTASEVSLPDAASSPMLATYFLAGVDVENESTHGSIVVLGDSITDGGVDSWPALLSQRLSKESKIYGVLNAGISGNRLLSGVDGTSEIYGKSALSRFDREVLDQPGVRYVVVYEGINDLGLGENTKSDGSNPATATDIISAIRHLAQRAHQRKVKMYLATLTPFEGTPVSMYYSPEKDVARKNVNHWIRTSDEIDGYFDFDRALADPAHPSRIDPRFDGGDHLHPNSAGQRALCEAVDLSKFD